MTTETSVSPIYSSEQKLRIKRIHRVLLHDRNGGLNFEKYTCVEIFQMIRTQRHSISGRGSVSTQNPQAELPAGRPSETDPQRQITSSQRQTPRTDTSKTLPSRNVVSGLYRCSRIRIQCG